MVRSGGSAMSGYRIERGAVEHAEAVAKLVAALLFELSGGARHVDVADLLPVAQERLRSRSNFFAYIAFDQVHDPVGVITVSTAAAIYAAGTVGTIQELYVVPAHRSAGLGQSLLATAAELGRKSGWNRIEVGAPSEIQWQRTINFYKANGFSEIGPRLQQGLAE
jgi:GNAT superfamily N-acetyltransferase